MADKLTEAIRRLADTDYVTAGELAAKIEELHLDLLVQRLVQLATDPRWPERELPAAYAFAPELAERLRRPAPDRPALSQMQRDVLADLAAHPGEMRSPVMMIREDPDRFGQRTEASLHQTARSLVDHRLADRGTDSGDQVGYQIRLDVIVDLLAAERDADQAADLAAAWRRRSTGGTA